MKKNYILFRNRSYIKTLMNKTLNEFSLYCYLKSVCDPYTKYKKLIRYYLKCIDT